MIQMLFSLHFQSQLRRIRPELIASLESAVVRAAEIAGAKVREEHRCITASFEEHTIGFALDVLLVLKAVQGAVQEAFPELYGYTCVFGRDIAENGTALLNRLPWNFQGNAGEEVRGTSGKDPQASGIWCSRELQGILDPYAVFDESPFGGDLAGYGQLRELKPLARLLFDGGEPDYSRGEANRSPWRDRLQGEGGARNALLVGPGFAGRQEAGSTHVELAEYLGALPDFPPLVFRFGCGGTGLSCFADALEDPIRDLIPPEKQEILKSRGAFLFKERLEDEFTFFAMKEAGLFLSGLLESYFAAALDRGAQGTILIKNVHLANPAAARVFVAVYAGLESAGTLTPAEPLLLGTSRDDPSLGVWETL
jgi:hypothetical protein